MKVVLGFVALSLISPLANAATLDLPTRLGSLEATVATPFTDRSFSPALEKAQQWGIPRVYVIPKSNIVGLSDAPGARGPGHGKPVSALEKLLIGTVAPTHIDVRTEVLRRVVGESLSSFHEEINRAQRGSGNPELDRAQLSHFVDVSYWKRPSEGHAWMAYLVADSEVYQLPPLTPKVRARLISVKLAYYTEIAREVNARFSNSELRTHLSTQRLTDREVDFVVGALRQVIDSRGDTGALFKFGSQPFLPQEPIPPTGVIPPFPPTLVPPGVVLPPVVWNRPSVPVAPPIVLVLPPDYRPPTGPGFPSELPKQPELPEIETPRTTSPETTPDTEEFFPPRTTPKSVPEGSAVTGLIGFGILLFFIRRRTNSRR